ncbi:serine/threonine protein phosphatase 1 [Terribacillus halophilus]|uniref:Serine/threonine protein phosphatase 1 n=1 Tax=Terribacillus halophilus TaxID=361279 RepID=A0A1G6QY15_9BACI|nr:metallophosphoesterase [Terribacillus halophilus]SDC96536.1 serine/threonine protein phosphatase 1 [Terribacillus halophilus]
MPKLYAMSDIHGCYEAMMDTLRLVDLDTSEENKLILLGDYVDGGADSCRVLYHIKHLEEQYPKQVITLLGNHEKMFIDWYTTLDDKSRWLTHDFNLLTIKSFFSGERFEMMEKQPVMTKGSYYEISHYIVRMMKEKHEGLLNWLSEKNTRLPYYETENQIYVHAGICEEDGEHWKHATKTNDFFWKYPAETGIFMKDIIAGHVSTAEVADDKSYLGRAFWDKTSHFYIDGETVKSNIIPLLRYDVCKKSYSSYEKEKNGYWLEYPIVKR